MFESTEIYGLVLATAILALLGRSRARLADIPGSGLLVAGFLCMYGGLLFTNAEGVALYTFCNIAEHVCNVAASALLVAWLWASLGRDDPEARNAWDTSDT